MSSRQARVLVAVAALLLAVASGAGGNAAAASRGGCELSSTTCYFFDVSLSGSGSGTYATLDADSQFTGRIVCHYGNEQRTGVCGWGYDVSPGGSVGVTYQLTPDNGSQACNTEHCYGGTFSGTYTIPGNYGDMSWRFELIDPIQVDVTTDSGGIGKVTSDPPGIDCPLDCTDLFAARNDVTLTARAQAGYVFAGWTGGCAGTTPTCTINASTAVAVHATFSRKSTPPADTEPPAEETETPTEAPTEVPSEVAATEAATAEITTAPTSDAPTATPVLEATADPSTVGSSGGGGNLPLVLGLVVVFLALVGGAVFALRRGGGLGGT